MYSALLVILTFIAQSGHSLVFQLPTLNDNVYPGESSIMAWGDFGDVTAVNVYLAHGTPSNYTILQTLGENIPTSTTSMMYHLPTTLPPTDVFFMLEGNDSPKSVATRSVYVDYSRGGFGTFPSISFPSDIFPSDFPFGRLPLTSVSTPNPTIHPTSDHHTDSGGLPMPAIIGIALGSFFFSVTVILTAIIMKRRTMIKKRRALLLQHQQQNGTPKPPPKWSEKPTDINVNVAIQGLPESQPENQQQQQQHTEYNYNYQPEYNYNHQQEYNYNPQYDYEQQTDSSYTNQQPSYSSPGGFIVPSPKTAAPLTPYPQAPTHDNHLHDISSPTAALSTPAPAYGKLASTKTSVAAPAYENKPNSTSLPADNYHKPNENHPSDKPHSSPTMQKPHSHSPP